MKALILAGGHGTRLRPITYTMQKQLIPVANKPVLFHIIEDLKGAGITDIGIIVGPNKEEIMERVGDGSKWNVNIKFIEQDAPKGLAHAVMISENFLKDDEEGFIMYLGDSILQDDVKPFVEAFKKSDLDVQLMLTRVADPENYGVAVLNDDNTIKQLLEKPKNPPNNLVIVGVYGFRNSVFKAVKSIKPAPKGELEITDAIQWMIENENKVSYHEITRWWKDTGRPEDLLAANRLVLENLRESKIDGEIEEGALIHGKVIVGKNSIVKSGATIRGPCIIGKDVVIDKDAYIGPYTSVGNGSKVISGEIEHSILMDNVHIECNSKITDSVCGKNSKIINNHVNRKPRGHRILIGDQSVIELD